MLKHLRQHRMTQPFDSLLHSASLLPSSPLHVLEHPLLTSLYNLLVIEGDFAEAENVVEKIHDSGLMDGFISKQKVTYKWIDSEEDARGTRPGRRGGHGMCLNEDDGRTYLFGGWDGSKELDDFWVREPLSFESPSKSSKLERDDIAMDDGVGSVWSKIQPNSSSSLWPPSTNGHSMCTDGEKIYMMGAHLPMLKMVPSTSSQSGSGPETQEGGAQSDATDSMTTAVDNNPAGFGLVSNDLMEVVEVAKAAVGREAKAHVLWAFDLSTREWEIVSDGREVSR